MFEELLKLSCTSVEFSFNNQIYKQIDGISIGSPLGPIIYNIFVVVYKYKLLSKQSFLYYKRYIDDTFAVFTDKTEKRSFLTKLNKLHNNFEFLIENSVENKLLFLDVLVDFESPTFSPSVYKKKITGYYIPYIIQSNAIKSKSVSCLTIES